VVEITEEELRDAVEYKDAVKGYEYYKKGLVLECDIEERIEDYIVLNSQVLGQYENSYKQQIKLYKKFNRLDVMGACTCPVRLNCKHVFASSLYYINHLQNAQKAMVDVEQWLETLHATAIGKKIVSDYIQSDSFIIYRVFQDQGKYYKEDVKFAKAKILKNGKLSKGTKVKSDSLLYSHSYTDIIDRQDEEIISLLKGIIPRSYSTDSQELKGEIGGLLLKKMIETGRCYYMDNEQPLSFHEKVLDLQFTWKEESDGLFSLEMGQAYQELYFTDSIPLMGIDTTLNKVYKFSSNIDGKMIQVLKKAPKVGQDELYQVYEIVSKIVGNNIIETPKDFETEVIEQKPVPVLLLFRVYNEIQKFHSMQLDFAYGGYLVSYFPKQEEVSFFQDGKKIQIRRDLDFEASCIETLESFGFSGTQENSVLYFLSLAEPDMQTALARWKYFLEVNRLQLEEKGWDIQIDESFTMQFDKGKDLTFEANHDDSNNWFEFSYSIDFNGEKKQLVDLVTPIIEQFDSFEFLPQTLNVEVQDNHFLSIEKQELESVLKTIFSLYDKKQSDGTLKVAHHEAHLIDIDENIIFKGPKELSQLSKKLKNYQGLRTISTSKEFTAKLREYQQDGLNWLWFLYEFGFGGILADDMGLGKTIQTLALLSKLKEENKLMQPSLIIMPTSLIANWKNEAKTFAPNLKVLSLHGQDRGDAFKVMKEYDLLLSTYPLISRDFETLNKEKYFYIILDEAQKIKNPNTKMTKAIKQLSSEHRLALSGTPIENHLGELWSIFSFLMPGFLDTQSFFKNYYQTPIEKHHDMAKKELLNKRIKPFMIRRTKDQVMSELPSKSVIVKYTQFDTKQSKLYESIRITMEKKVKDAIEKKGIDKSHITILDALLKLRQVCCDPSLLKLEEAQKVKESAKLELFLDLVEELLAEGRKILVFSQFTSMLSVIEKKFVEQKIAYLKFTGNTKNRESVINDFKNGMADIFLISLKAGGVGLNLVEADTVIHYDPWWNPAVENQATDRAYRIGQTKAVFVYKLIIENSIEQKILELQVKKQSLQNGIFEAQNEDIDIFKGEELLTLLQ
jgi:SNF2 family DNA or RNA helicase